MKLNNVDMLITNIEEKENSNTRLPYWKVKCVDLTEGDSFDINLKERDIAEKLEIMTKYNLNLSLNNSQYGMRLSIDSINKKLGNILFDNVSKIKE